MNLLVLVEVFYNKEGSFTDPNSTVRKNLPYHSVIVPAFCRWNDEAEANAEKKVREWFAKNKPEYKIIKMISTPAV